MKAEELRIGNVISTPYGVGNVYGINHECVQITILDDKTVFDFDLEECKPIPLTEEWLLKFGFVNRYSNVWMKEDNERENVFEFDDNNLYFTAEEGVNYSVAINNIHQLQNFYFALTDTELTIK